MLQIVRINGQYFGVLYQSIGVFPWFAIVWVISPLVGSRKAIRK